MKKIVLSAMALTVSAGLVGLTGPVAQAAPIPSPVGADPAPAAVGAAYLAAQPESTGIITSYYDYPVGPPFESSVDVGLTIDAAWALDAVGTQPAALATMTAAVEDSIDSYAFGGGSKAKAAAFLLSQGVESTEVDGLIADLEANHVGDAPPIVGRIVDADPDDYNTPLTQTFLAAALDAAGSDVADEALGFLLAQQCEEGFFRDSFAAKDAPDQACDDATSPTGSVDTTGLAVIQLQAQKSDTAVSTAIASAAEWLVTQQAADGSFNSGNANSTGLAGWALGLSGDTASAAKAASWLRAHQLANAGACTPFAAKDNGAVTLDDLGYTNAQAGPMDDLDNSSATRATTQALPALLWAPGGAAAGATTVTATKDLVRGGSAQTVGLAGAPGNTLCVTAAGKSTTVVLPADGDAMAQVTLPNRTLKNVVRVVDAGGETDSVTIQGLGKKAIKFRSPARVKNGAKVVVEVRGLKKGESITLKFRGTKVAQAKARANGTKTLRFVAKGVGGGKLLVKGQFNNRRGTQALTVLR